MSEGVSEDDLQKIEQMIKVSFGEINWHGLIDVAFPKMIAEIRRLRAEISELELQEQLLLQLSDAYKEERDLLRAENEKQKTSFNLDCEYRRLIALGKAVEAMPMDVQLIHTAGIGDDHAWYCRQYDEETETFTTALEALQAAKEA